jgi:tetratricopeptide (TPR) repeat protein
MTWRRGLLVTLTAAALCAVIAGAVLYALRRDLWSGSSATPDLGGLTRKTLLGAKGSLPPPTPAAPEAPARPPRPKIVSWEGLGVEPCVSDLRMDLMVRRTLDHLDQDLLDAVKDLKDASGLFPVSENRVVIVPVARGEVAFREAYATALAKNAARVQLPLEPLVLGWWPTRSALASALAEAILLQEAPQYAEAPPWLRHGIALHLSRFGSEYADRALLESPLAPPQLVRPLDEAGDLAWLDGYWAVKALSARSGDEVVKRWVQGMFEGLSWKEALKASAGETPQAFEEKYQAWTTAYLRDRCVNRQELVDAVALLRLQKESQALPALETLVRNRPLDLYAGNAKYFLNYARFREGDYREAINGFTDLLVNAPASTTWQGKAHYFLGRSYQLSGYWPLAIREFMLSALDPDSALLRKLSKERLAEVEK